MAKRKFSGPMTAEELMAQLRADPEWVAANQAREKKRAELHRYLRENEAPIVRDLVEAGYNVKSVDELSKPYPDAIPILLEHLQKFETYDHRVRGSIAHALTTEEAKGFVPELLEIFQSDPDRSLLGGKGITANAIWELAGEGFILDIARIALEQRHGPSRAGLVYRLGESKSEVARRALKTLTEDPDKEVSLRAKDMLEKMSKRKPIRQKRYKRKGYRIIDKVASHPYQNQIDRGQVEFKRPFLMRKIRHGLSETSTGFDADRLPGFLVQLGELGLTSRVADAVIAELAEMEIKEERLLEFEVEFKGRTIPLQVLLYLEDMDSPSVYFFSTHDLTSAIDRIMGGWMDAE